MSPALWAVALSIGLFVGMVAFLEAGYRAGRHSLGKHLALAHEGIGVIEAAVFALLGLLLGFSFSGGMSRLDARRQLIVREANAIGTAYLRLDLLPAANQPEMRRLFRDYLDRRLVYEKPSNPQAAERELRRAQLLQQQIWSGAVTASRADPSQDVARLLLPALNEMIDVTTSRTIALNTHLPPLIFALLLCVALLSSLLAGYAMAKRQDRSWLHLLLYALVVALTVYALLDLEDPRSGLIRLDAAERALTELRDSIR
jgi:Protein of unknown function (DUF4239)